METLAAEGGAEGLYKVQKGCTVGVVPPAPVLINNALPGGILI